MNTEDDKQFLKLLRLLQVSNPEQVLEQSKRSKQRKEKKVLKAEDIYWKNKLSRNPYTSSLAAVLYPTNNKLGSVPMFKRYVAYLITEHGCTGTGKLLGISRTTLWRYFYGLDSSGRA